MSFKSMPVCFWSSGAFLLKQGLLALWHHRLITAGTNWAHAIDQYLETASVVLLLVSADFFASDYCVGIEMKRALERQEAGEARVIPILVRSVDWNGAPFAHLHKDVNSLPPTPAFFHVQGGGKFSHLCRTLRHMSVDIGGQSTWAKKVSYFGL